MIAEVLSGQYNYNTYMLGKWHLGETEVNDLFFFIDTMLNVY